MLHEQVLQGLNYVDGNGQITIPIDIRTGLSVNWKSWDEGCMEGIEPTTKLKCGFLQSSNCPAE